MTRKADHLRVAAGPGVLDTTGPAWSGCGNADLAGRLRHGARGRDRTDGRRGISGHVAGAGGTNWALVEGRRDERAGAVAAAFAAWAAGAASADELGPEHLAP